MCDVLSMDPNMAKSQQRNSWNQKKKKKNYIKIHHNIGSQKKGFIP